MKNWKTTLAGVFSIAAQVLPLFGVPAEVGAAITTIAIFAIGFFAKDSNVTGGTVSQ